MPVNQKLIVIITAVYPPEPVVSARMSFDLATYLVSIGMSVTVLCPQPTRPIGAEYTAFRDDSGPLCSLEEGVSVVRLPSYSSPASTIFSRFRESYSFGSHVCRYLDEAKLQPDVIYVNSWPMIAQSLIVSHGRRAGIPLVLQIMDIYPESLLIKLPTAARKFISTPLKMLDAWIAKSSDNVIVISENMRRVYLNERGVSIDRVKKIYTWQDETNFNSSSNKELARKNYGIPTNLFTFLYLGNIGQVAGVDFLIKAFHAAQLDSSQLVIVGDGAAKNACQELVEKIQAKNIHFISDPDIANVPILQNMADVCLLPIKKNAGLSSIPSKLPAYLFSSKPVIATVDLDSDTADVIRQAGCGWVGNPEDLHWLSSKMKEVAKLPQAELESLGNLGKQFGLKEFSKCRGVKRLADVLLGVTRSFND